MKIGNSIILFLVLFISCNKKNVFDENQSIVEYWNKDSIVTFNIKKIDTTKKYDLFINLTNNDQYPYNNIFLIVTTETSKNKKSADTLEYLMASSEGDLLGSGFFDTKESKLYYKEDIKLPEKLNISIGHAVRENGKTQGVTNLKGITKVGLRIEEKE